MKHHNVDNRVMMMMRMKILVLRTESVELSDSIVIIFIYRLIFENTSRNEHPERRSNRK